MRDAAGRDFLKNSEFLQSRSKEPSSGMWFANFYLWLQENPQYKDVWGPRGGYKGQEVKRYHDFEFILTADNLLKKGGEVYILDLPSDKPVLNELATLLQNSKPIIHPDILSATEHKDCKKLRGFLTGFCGVQILDAEKVCKEMVLPKIISKAQQPSPDDLLSLTKLCKEILGSDLGEGIELWVRTKSKSIKTSKEVLLSSELKPLRNWETHQAFIPGLSFIDDTYLSSDCTDDDLRMWRDFFKAAGIRDNPDSGVEQFAINFALEKLKSKYKNVQLVEKLNYGFDIQAETSDGTQIQVEVKGVSDEKDVELTGNEADAADKYKKSFYLCVVSLIPNSPTIHLVNDPAQPGVGKKDKLTIPVDVWKVSETI